MNKSELIAQIAKESAVSLETARGCLDSTLDIIGRTLAANEKITLVGFGTFATSERAERKGRNPRTGEELTIAAKTLPKFTAGKTLKEQVNV